MGTAIADLVTRAGHNAQRLGTGDLEQPVTGTVVVLAVPYPAVDDVLAQRGNQLSGRIVVDITNPVNFETFASRYARNGHVSEDSPVRKLCRRGAYWPSSKQLARCASAGESSHSSADLCSLDGGLVHALVTGVARAAIHHIAGETADRVVESVSRGSTE
ncbi:NAD(P)-binding domain-containing protein [Nocardia sp. AB354]|uniref:NAD(P)-binding domain-containing protein n=1 Tax=Nocardia sp. AB354 TaxID=3413283 RepID=UPI003C250D9F